MYVYLPIAEMSVNVLVLLGLGAAVGFLSGLFGVGGGFLMTPLLMFLGIPPAAGEKITELLWAKLKAKPGLRVLSPNEARVAARDLAGGGTTEPLSAHKIAQRLGADAALSGKVLVYQERVGSRLGADPPAAVGFEVKLVASDGMVLWEGNYYEKQRPMTEDFVGFIQRSGVFVTADELAAYGAAELADVFPYGGTGGGAH
jgi:hypothetical protein